MSKLKEKLSSKYSLFRRKKDRENHQSSTSLEGNDNHKSNEILNGRDYDLNNRDEHQHEHSEVYQPLYRVRTSDSLNEVGVNQLGQGTYTNENDFFSNNFSQSEYSICSAYSESLLASIGNLDVNKSESHSMELFGGENSDTTPETSRTASSIESIEAESIQGPKSLKLISNFLPQKSSKKLIRHKSYSHKFKVDFDMSEDQFSNAQNENSYAAHASAFPPEFVYRQSKKACLSKKISKNGLLQTTSFTLGQVNTRAWVGF